AALFAFPDRPRRQRAHPAGQSRSHERAWAGRRARRRSRENRIKTRVAASSKSGQNADGDEEEEEEEEEEETRTPARGQQGASKPLSSLQARDARTGGQARRS
ncbi:unnamed protein product, partial [Prorocentrum cordatum]